jgi:hypothetical protein
MAIKKRYISTTFWRDNYIIDLDPSEKLLFLYLLTNPDTNILGVYQIPIRQISMDTGFDKEMVIKILERFQKDNKVLYQDGWIAIKNFAKNQNYKSPYIQTAIETEFLNIPFFIQQWLKDGLDTVLDGIDTIININLNKDKGKNKTKKQFKKPTPEEVQEYLDKIECTYFTGEYFVDKNDSIGWVVGKNKTPMKDWKATVRTWVNNQKKNNSETPYPYKRDQNDR